MNPLRLLILLSLLGTFDVACAFHDGGVASCAACHMMHNGSDDFIEPPSHNNKYLLRFDSPTDVCLSCHGANNGSVWAQTPTLPAPERGSGNFVFIGAANINDAPNGALYPLSGSHGVHNCENYTFNAGPDPVNTMAPGGVFPAARLACTSCHDPHGNENFRMLRGAGFVPAGQITFAYPAPVAQGIPLTGAAESPSLHTAYQSGWTNWCANCHGFYHQDARDGFRHVVAGALPSEARNSYEHYDGSSNPTGGNPLTSYLPQVPFEDPNITTTSTYGPSTRSQISCITCHRAHGSSAVDAGRWDFQVVNLRMDGIVSGSYPLPMPYRGTVERSLCLKCHEPDTRTHGFAQACLECHRSSLDAMPHQLLREPSRLRQ
ncbi:MAG: hypothetical protein IPK53_17925 [bacterium]|nr:hypothetical protein [bacterium]MBK8130693.1 hypothetical protein [bacterium]